MDPLRSPPPVFDPDDIERIAGRVFGIAGLLTPLASERDLNFRLDDERGRSFLLKVQNPADDVSVVEFQTEAVLHVERQDPGLPVMRVVPTVDGDHWVAAGGGDGRISLVRMFTFVGGHNPSTEELDEAALREWGVKVARLGGPFAGSSIRPPITRSCGTSGGPRRFVRCSRTWPIRPFGRWWKVCWIDSRRT
jgi:hydroxylysine kinase